MGLCLSPPYSPRRSREYYDAALLPLLARWALCWLQSMGVLQVERELLQGYLLGQPSGRSPRPPPCLEGTAPHLPPWTV